MLFSLKVFPAYSCSPINLLHFFFHLGTCFPEDQTGTVGTRISPQRQIVIWFWGEDHSLPGWQGLHPVWSVGHGSSLAQDGSLIAKAFFGIRAVKAMRGTIHTRIMDLWDLTKFSYALQRDYEKQTGRCYM